MKKVLILGCCGAGKSTFANALHKHTGIPLVHLDQHFWKAGWVESSTEEWTATINQLCEKETWIMDGNYGGTLDVRIEAADTILFMDGSTVKCLYRVLKRTVQYHGNVRPDMPAGCPERFDLPFLHYVLMFNKLRRKKILNKLKAVNSSKEIFILDSEQKARAFIDCLERAR